MSSSVREEALAYLRAHQVMTLATVDSTGVWAAAVFYVNDGFNLYFLSAGHTRHAQNMQSFPRVSAAIHEDYEDWLEIQGIQLEGEVVCLSGEAKRLAISLFRSKFPFITGGIASIQSALGKVNWYRLTPDRFYYIDNSKGFGHRDEVIMSEG
jgi:uncharacterized protein YhbP (UPF0306 family)